MNLYLPHIARLGYILDPLAGEDKCNMNYTAIEFARAWLRELGDRAYIMRCDERLVRCAQDHAVFLAGRVDISPSMHIGQGGSYANQRVVEAGYPLPDWELKKNYVESCSFTWKDPGNAAISLMNHDGPHEDHMKGIGSFYSKSTVYGVGAQRETGGNTYFVFVACPPQEN